MMASGYDSVVVGGGLYGCLVALHRRRRGDRVLLLEAAAALLTRASYANQARVHHGYHYPRSLLTALRSRANYARFADEYRDCIDHSFVKYYAIARLFSKITAAQFKTFCRRVGMPVQAAPRDVHRLFNPTLIEDVFATEETAFDACALRRRLDESLAREGVEVRTGCTVRHLDREPRLRVAFDSVDGSSTADAGHIFNCTYSGINDVAATAGAAAIPLKHEIAELALVRMPEPFRGVGITVMDGPFFSAMPFPARGLHSLSHVRYTPHGSWYDDGVTPGERPAERLRNAARVSSYPLMLHDVQRYVPELRGCEYVESLWEVKTLLPASDRDDSRPILFHQDPSVPGLTSILGGKIDNIYDVLAELDLRDQAPRVH
jgi:glycine/D-amino acid oxidase-like deaminating enzyme